MFNNLYLCCKYSKLSNLIVGNIYVYPNINEILSIVMPIDWIFYLNMMVKRMNLWRVIDILHIEYACDTVFRYSNSLDN